MTDEPKTVDLLSVEARLPPESQLPMLQFNLRQLFWMITFVGVLVGGVTLPSPGMAPLALILASFVVLLHLASTAIGSQLRIHADQTREWQLAQPQTLADERDALSAVPAAPLRSPWHADVPRMRWLPFCVAAGALAGSIVGALLLASTIGHRSSPVGVIVGAISTAVLGGWFAFLGSSFWIILRQAWDEAVNEHTKDATHRS